ncbi:MAG TPA: hypothetical protein VFG30_17690 [Polyangiales bacterium]|nr:hypothetical protein [Polyangiales bacterium]
MLKPLDELPTSVTRNGRRGQTQHGVDIFGYPGDDKTRLNCVQCKCVKGIDFAEVKAEIEKVRNFRPVPT